MVRGVFLLRGLDKGTIIMMYSVILAAALLMIGIRVMKLDWDHMQ